MVVCLSITITVLGKIFEITYCKYFGRNPDKTKASPKRSLDRILLIFLETFCEIRGLFSAETFL